MHIDLGVWSWTSNLTNEFPYDNVSTKAKTEDLVSLLYTAWYVARNARSQTDCNECKELFGNNCNTMDFDHIHFQYIHYQDRGIDLPSEYIIKCYGPAGSL